MEQEAWLSGALKDVPPMLMPAAHALVQAARDIKQATGHLTESEIWAKPSGATSVGFHLLHIAGSCDRLLTYARGETLSEKQFAVLNAESAINLSISAVLLTEKAIVSIQTVIEEIRVTPDETLFEKREVGRKKLQTNIFGLLFHIAEHTQRHVGQIITTAKIVRSPEFKKQNSP